MQPNDNDLLAKIVKTRLTTTFIGALDDIERVFGELWFAEDGEVLSEEEKQTLEEWKQAFAEVRKMILDRGNGQIRAFFDEVDKFEVKWIGPKLYMKKDNNER